MLTRSAASCSDSSRGWLNKLCKLHTVHDLKALSVCEHGVYKVECVCLKPELFLDAVTDSTHPGRIGAMVKTVSWLEFAVVTSSGPLFLLRAVWWLVMPFFVSLLWNQA